MRKIASFMTLLECFLVTNGAAADGTAVGPNAG